MHSRVFLTLCIPGPEAHGEPTEYAGFVVLRRPSSVHNFKRLF